MYWQNNSFWNKVREGSAELEDIEQHVYSPEYLNIQNPAEYTEIKNEYNTNLKQYFFEVEKYQNEEDYREIFFQGFLDGVIDEKEYYNAENTFINLIYTLADTGNVYACFDFSVPIEDNHPLKKSSDVNFDFEFLKENQGKFIKLSDRSYLRQISILLAREIVGGYIVFENIKLVLTCSGMHGCIFSDEKLDSDLLSKISVFCLSGQYM